MNPIILDAAIPPQAESRIVHDYALDDETLGFLLSPWVDAGLFKFRQVIDILNGTGVGHA